MSIKCAHCGARHTRIETVRQCAADAAVVKARVAELPSDVRIALDTDIVQAASTRGAKRLPSGCYWTGGEVGGLMIRIRVPEVGRWKGRYFVNASYNWEPEKAVFSKRERDQLIETLLEQDWGLMMLEYGKNTGKCPVCDGALMTPDEEKVGVHSLKGPHGGDCAMTVIGKKGNGNGSGG